MKELDHEKLSKVSGGFPGDVIGYRITQECLGCMSCVPVCPSGAIVEDGNKCRIDGDRCTRCGACKDECPLLAIVPILE